MEHGTPTGWRKEKSEGAKTKLGLYLFLVYSAVYFTFVFICVFNPRLMATDVGSLNLAIAFGFGLIVFAIILALIYNYICSKREKEDAEQAKEK